MRKLAPLSCAMCDHEKWFMRREELEADGRPPGPQGGELLSPQPELLEDLPRHIGLLDAGDEPHGPTITRTRPSPFSERDDGLDYDLARAPIWQLLVQGEALTAFDTRRLMVLR